MHIVLTSTSPLKQQAVFEFFQLYFGFDPHLHLLSVNVDLPNNPVNDGGEYCATQRLERAQVDFHFDMIVSVENFMLEYPDGTYRDHCFVLIQDSEGNRFSVVSDGIDFDQEAAKAMLASTPTFVDGQIIGYSQTVGKYFATQDSSVPHDDFMRVLCNYPRVKQIKNALFKLIHHLTTKIPIDDLFIFYTNSIPEVDLVIGDDYGRKLAELLNCGFIPDGQIDAANVSLHLLVAQKYLSDGKKEMDLMSRLKTKHIRFVFLHEIRGFENFPARRALRDHYYVDVLNP